MSKIKLDDIDKAKEIYNVYHGVHTPEKLSKKLYLATANKLNQAVAKGYGKKSPIKNTIDSEVEWNSPDYEMLQELDESIFMFSAAKTFQQTVEMSDALVSDDGEVLSFSQFQEAAGDIFDRYNEDWLEAEYNTAITSARSAAKWVDVQDKKESLPYLRYSATMDEHTCEICAPLDDITLPVDDPFWDSSTPPNHFNCECGVEQLSEDDIGEVGGLSDRDEVSEAVESSQENKNPIFNFNPGKDKSIFQDTGRNKHPYFEVPAKYKELAKDNFNLPIPN
jgi:SPP1 gp7 family putative phage head morphogenesis protein